MRTVLKLRFIRQTDKARYYEKPNGRTQWVPISVCPVVTPLDATMHEVTIEDWWLAQNPFDRPDTDQPTLL